MRNTELGKKGEMVAAKFLENQDYCIMAKNFQCSQGEIDIIATDKNEIVFVEVKTRCSKKYGEAREAVDKIKRKHIKKAAMHYIYKHQLENNFIRFDVIEVYLRDNQFFVNHIKNALW